MAQVVAGAIPVTHPAFLAQLVEHLSCKQRVTGSSPVGGSSLEQSNTSWFCSSVYKWKRYVSKEERPVVVGAGSVPARFHV